MATETGQFHMEYRQDRQGTTEEISPIYSVLEESYRKNVILFFFKDKTKIARTFGGGGEESVNARTDSLPNVRT